MITPLAVGHPVAAVHIADVDVVTPTDAADVEELRTSLSTVLTEEFDGARRHLGLTVQELLLAALGGAVAKAIGSGTMRIGCAGTAAGSATVILDCVDHHGLAANEALIATRRALAAASDGVAGTDVRFGFGDPVVGRPAMLDLAVTRDGPVLALCWRYDRTQLLAGTVADLADQYALALVELTTEAVAPVLDTAA